MTTTSELRSRLESKGEELSQIAHRLEDRIDEYKDITGLVRQYPLQSIGVAAGLGLLLSGSGGFIIKQVLRQVGLIAQAGAMAAVVSALNEPKTTQRI